MARRHERLDFLDAVRGIAAMAVVVWHVSESGWTGGANFGNRWFNLGRLGVCAFFLVSGFVIPMSIERSRTMADFVIRRVCRLYPLYWLSLAGAMVLSLSFRDILPAAFEHRLPLSGFVNATMLQEFVRVPHAIAVYYTLTIELAWYVACVALHRVGLLARTEALVWTVLGGFTAACVVLPLLIDRRAPFSTPFYGVVLLVGTALYRHYEGKLSTRRLAVIAAATLVVGVAAGSIAQARFGAPRGSLHALAAVLPWCVAFALVFGFYRGRLATWPRPLTRLGLISYSLYLLHVPIFGVAAHVTDNAWTRAVLTIAGSIVISQITWRFVEAPGQSLGRRWVAHRNKPADLVSS